MESEGRIALVALRHDEGLHDRNGTRRRYEFLRGLLSPGDDVLDIGTNSGAQLALLSSIANMVTGIDIEESRIKIAIHNNRHLENVRIIQMNAMSLNFPDNTFHAVSSFECIEHVQNPKKMLSEMARVVKQDGIVVLSTPNRELSGSRLASKEHLQEWTFEEFNSLVTQFFNQVEWYGQRIIDGSPRQKLYRPIRSSFIYNFYEILPKRTKVLASAIFQNMTFGNTFEVRRLNFGNGERSKNIVTVLRGPKKSIDR